MVNNKLLSALVLLLITASAVSCAQRSAAPLLVDTPTDTVIEYETAQQTVADTKDPVAAANSDKTDYISTISESLDILLADYNVFDDEQYYIDARPEAFAAIVALGEDAIPYLDNISIGFVPYDSSVENYRRIMAMAAKYAIKPELYDLVYTSPDGRAQLKLSPLTFHTLWEPFTGITYTLSITDTESGASLIPENFVCEVSGDFEIFWSPDGRYAALSQGYRHLFTSLIIFDVRTSKLTDLSDRAAIQSALGQELLVLDSDTNNTYDRLHCYFESFCGDTVQYTVALQSAHGDEIQIGRLTADLASGYVTAFD